MNPFQNAGRATLGIIDTFRYQKMWCRCQLLETEMKAISGLFWGYPNELIGFKGTNNSFGIKCLAIVSLFLFHDDTVMKSKGKEHLRLIKTFSSLSMSRSCPKKKTGIYSSCNHLYFYFSLVKEASVFMFFWFYTRDLHDHVSVSVYSLCLYRFTFSYTVFCGI